MTTLVKKTLDELMQDFDFRTYSDNKEKIWDEDPLVLAVSLKDLADKTCQFQSLNSHQVKENVTEEHRQQAEVIRKYYGKKFFWTSLTNNRSLSPFRTRLCYLLESRTRVTQDKDEGIYYKLPWFYEEDMAYEDFKLQYKTTDLPKLDYKVQPVAKMLSFIKTTTGWQAKRKVEYFWFKDSEDYLHGIAIDCNNPLLELFKGIVTENPNCTFITRITEDRIDQMYYYKLHQFKLLKEKHA
jgi:hypothetical protein